MRVVVTGGAGFIGSNLVARLLSQGHQVTVLDNLSGGSKAFLAAHAGSKRLAFHKVDLRRTAQLSALLERKTDLVYHLAANSDISRGVDDPTLDYENTIEATFSLLQAMRRRGLRRILYTSGSGVYGDLGERYCREDGSLRPVSMYGAAKLGAEGLISSFVHLFDMQAFVLRPANIIGPQATHGVVFDFYRRLREDPRRLRILGDGLQSKSYLHVSDVLDAFELVQRAARQPLNIYNLATRTFITVNEIADLVVRGSGLQPKHVIYQHTGGRVGWKGDVPVIRIDSRALRRLGWRPRYNSRAAVKATIAALRVDPRFVR